ncbi:hypothetical protein GCM10027046_36030 [Uliginosibacterium flavum]|uniref:DUF4845 domain-containing protein n=1 Tax=Uliginosibacterium flavum TaxID=1396831 RepID=A0ABV2TNC2_9RHOO
MKRQNGMSLISVLIVGAILMAVLILGFKMVPVFNEYFNVKKAFASVVSTVDPAAPASSFRAAFGKFRDVNDITSVDAQTISVTKDGGKVTLQVLYRRELPLFANVGLYFDFDVTSDK